MLKKTILPALMAVPLVLGACGGSDETVPADLSSTNVDTLSLAVQVQSLPAGALSPAEMDGIVFIREEEKMARDVYLTLFDQWGAQVFRNISASEQSHMDAVLALINKYGLTDPVGDNGIGVFVNPDLQGLYDTLVSQGSASLIDALLSGTAIEEIDIIDLQNQLENVVDNQDIALVYENLLRGSRNHLRAFVSNLETQGMSYMPRYLSQEDYDEIIEGTLETGAPNGTARGARGANEDGNAPGGTR